MARKSDQGLDLGLPSSEYEFLKTTQHRLYKQEFSLVLRPESPFRIWTCRRISLNVTRISFSMTPGPFSPCPLPIIAESPVKIAGALLSTFFFTALNQDPLAYTVSTYQFTGKETSGT